VSETGFTPRVGCSDCVIAKPEVIPRMEFCPDWRQSTPNCTRYMIVRSIHFNGALPVAYFADLTSYVYRPAVCPQLLEGVQRICIGWLDGSHPFERGNVPAEVIGRIEELCKSPVRRTRGWHDCPFCPEYPATHRLQDGHQMTLGDAEIEVQSKDVIYVSPTLILHYMTVHQYKPPAEFLSAVLQSKR
jgi:hypothetical protein